MSDLKVEDDLPPLETVDFGQVQPIHVAIRNLIHDYPRDEGILKELIQNADDGGASEVRFILDLSDRGSVTGPVSAWSELAEPAIVSINNKPFSERDLERIRRLGDSGKVESPSETGKYGRGFNAVYNITDTPLLLTGNFVGFFDPCKWFVEKGTGAGWPIDENFLTRCPEALSLFKTASFDPEIDRHSTSAFRFPLRSVLRGKSHEDRISDELFMPTEFERLVDGLASLSEHLIFFLRNIRFIGCYVCLEPQGELETLLEITTLNEDEVIAGRSKVNDILSLGSVGDVLQHVGDSPSGRVESIYPHEVRVTRPEKVSCSKWMVCTGLYSGQDLRLIHQARTLNEAHNRAVPAAGAAVCVDRDGQAFPVVEGTVSCFLPLSKMLGGAVLPFHINGAFDLDGSRTGITRTQEGQTGSTRDRAQWNQMLVEDAVTPAAASLLAICHDHASSAAALYRAFPDPCQDFSEPFSEFCEHLYRHLARLEVFGIAGRAWVDASALRLIPHDPDLQECLEIERFSVPVPPLPQAIQAGLIRADAFPQKLKGEEIREHFCIDEPGPWRIEEAPFAGLRSREAVHALSRYVASFEPRIRWEGLPLALCSDGMLRRFGHGGEDPFFIAGEKMFRVFSKFSEWFLDTESITQGRLPESGCDSFRVMAPDDFLDRLAFVTGATDSGAVPWNPEGEEVPNRSWLVEVFELINAFPENDSDLESSLRQAAIIPGHDGFLHRPGTAETPLLVQLAQQPLAEVLRLMSSPHWILSPQDPLTRVLTQFRDKHEMVWDLTQWDLVDTLYSKKALLSGDDAPWRSDPVVSRLLTFLQTEIKNDEFGDERTSKLRGLPLFKDSSGRFGPIDETSFFAGAFEPPDVKVPFRLLQEGEHGVLLQALGVSKIDRRKLLEECLLPRLAELEDASLIGVMGWVRDEWNHLVHDYEDEVILVSKLEHVACLVTATGLRKAPKELYHPGVRHEVSNLLGQKAQFPHTSMYGQEPQLWHRFFHQLGLATTPRPQDLVDFIEETIDRLEARQTTIEKEQSTLTGILKYVLEYWSSLAYRSVTSSVHGVCQLFQFLADTKWIVPERIENRFFDPREVEDRLYAPEELLVTTQAPRSGSVRCFFPKSISEFSHDIRERLRVDRIPSPSELCAHLQNVVSRYGEEAIEEADLVDLRKLVAGVYRGLGEHRQAAGDPPDFDKINKLEVICASFSDLPCLIITSEGRFRRPRDVYRTWHPRLSPLKASFRSEEMPVELGVGLLGRRDEPTIEDLAESLVALGERDEALSQTELAAVNAALHLIRTKGEELGHRMVEGEIRVPNAAGFLVEPGEVVFADDPGLEGQLSLDPHLILHEGAPFETCIYSVARLSQAMAKPVGTLMPSEDPGIFETCLHLQETIQSQEFAEGICRILQHEGSSFNLGHLRWLNRALVSALESVKCRFVVELGSGREVDLGRATVDVAYDQSLGDGGTFLVGESAMDVLYNRFADELARELDNGPMDKAPLVSILSLPADQIHSKLDRLGLARLREDDFGEDGEASDTDYDYFPEDEEDLESAADENLEGSEQSGASSEGGPVTDNRDGEETEAPSDKELEEDSNSDEDEEEQEDTPDDDLDEEEEDDIEEDDDPSDNSPSKEGRLNGRTSNGGGARGGTGQGRARSRSEKSDHDSTGNGRGGGGWSGPRGRMERAGRTSRENQGGGGNRPQRSAQDDLWISRPRTKQQVEQSKQQNDEGDDEAPRNHSIGDAAVGWVLQFERQQGRRPQNMAHNNPGYDIESRKGRVVERFIEVKGIDGEWGQNGVPLSSLQFFKFQDRPENGDEGSPPIGDRFWLYVVEHARDPENVKIHMIQDPAGKATEFRFDHGWKQAGETVTDFKPLFPAVGMHIRDLLDEDGKEGVILQVDQNDYLKVRFGTGPATTVVYRACDYELIDGDAD